MELINSTERKEKKKKKEGVPLSFSIGPHSHTQTSLMHPLVSHRPRPVFQT